MVFIIIINAFESSTGHEKADGEEWFIMKDDDKEVNFCSVWVESLAGKHSMNNKLRYMLETFLYEEGWASKTNDKVMKKGYHQQYTYNKQDIAHFIEDTVRVFEREWELEWDKIKKKQNHKVGKQ